MDPYLGQILAFAFGWAPMGFQICDGSILQIAPNSALYSLLGTYFGGNGTQTFGIPDLKGRTILGQGNGNGLTPRPFASMGGVEQVALSQNEMPIHNHTAAFTGTSVTVKASSALGSSGTPSTRSNTLGGSASGLYNSAAPDIALNIGGGGVAGNVAVANAGQSIGHNNMQPFTVLNYCIATQGIYPSRP